MSTITLITALGNHDDKYLHTRHNAGFWFLDALCQRIGGRWTFQSNLGGYLYKWQAQKIILFKPGKLMNINGGPIATCAKYFKIENHSILIAHDELDFPCGQVRIKTQGGHGGHNGMRDVLAHLQPNTSLRLRIGIDRPSEENSVSHYVLSPPSQSDRAKIDHAINFCLDKLPILLDAELGKYQELCHHLK